MNSLMNGLVPPNRGIIHPTPPNRLGEATLSFKKVAALVVLIFMFYSIYSSYMQTQEDVSFLEQWAVKYGGNDYDCPPEICTWIFEE